MNRRGGGQQREDRMRRGGCSGFLINIIKATEKNDVLRVMRSLLCCSNYCPLTLNNAAHDVLMPQGVQAKGEEMNNRSTWLGDRPQLSRRLGGRLCGQ